MPPLTVLEPVTWSAGTALGMLALRAYLIVGAILLVIKAIQIGRGRVDLPAAFADPLSSIAWRTSQRRRGRQISAASGSAVHAVPVRVRSTRTVKVQADRGFETYELGRAGDQRTIDRRPNSLPLPCRWGGIRLPGSYSAISEGSDVALVVPV